MLKYGPIICTEGQHKGRIGYFDDTDSDCSQCLEECCYHRLTRAWRRLWKYKIQNHHTKSAKWPFGVLMLSRPRNKTY